MPGEAKRDGRQVTREPKNGRRETQIGWLDTGYRLTSCSDVATGEKARNRTGDSRRFVELSRQLPPLYIEHIVIPFVIVLARVLLCLYRRGIYTVHNESICVSRLHGVFRRAPGPGM
jgi:hypothetical protein